MKLAKALLRRKELNDKLARMTQINQRDLYEVRVKRISVSDNLDEVTANVPKLTYSQFNKEYDHYAKQLREIDAVIQQANWNTDVEGDELLVDFIEESE